MKLQPEVDRTQNNLKLVSIPAIMKPRLAYKCISFSNSRQRANDQRPVYRFTMATLFILSLWVILASGQEDGTSPAGILYPIETESREVKSLDGIWNFRLAPRLDPDLGFREQWYSKPLEQTGKVDLMPVPSSYNDITQSIEVRDHVGWVWYDRNFLVPRSWQSDRRIFLRVGAAHYTSIVYINGRKVTEHAGGALPFLAELNGTTLNFNGKNLITVAINNTLTQYTVPQGSTTWQTDSRYPDGYFTMTYAFDFFNYAGIHRSILLYSTPITFIDDIDVTPRVNGTTGYVNYAVKSAGNPNGTVRVELQDKNGTLVTSGNGANGELTVPNAILWWPYTMVTKDNNAGYLYNLIVTLTDPNTNETDVYSLNVGIRTVNWTNTQFFINGKPFYFRGYGRHEDSDIRGRGFDNALLVKDHNLIKWTGGNSYRTSHYPYSEELMDVADRLGIVIIDEVAAVALSGFGPALLETHKQQIRDMIQRDKNRPSVVMWSIANEPDSNLYPEDSDVYFREIAALTRETDNRRRPITMASKLDHIAETGAKYLDILAINRYFAWYYDTAHTEIIKSFMLQEVQNWVNYYNKPIIVTEYGADTVPGFHEGPEVMFTEEFQLKYMREHFKAFDQLRTNSSLIGEHIWNFADFNTFQAIYRFGGNKKGIFTRQRQPKSSAHLLRHRYFLLAAEYDSYPMPEDLDEIVPIFDHRRDTARDEL